MTKALLYSILLSLYSLSGCTTQYTVSKSAIEVFSTECEGLATCTAAKTADAQEKLDYAREDARQLKEDRVRDILVQCDARDDVLVWDTSFISRSEKRRLRSRKNKEAGYPYIPKSLHSTDLACLTSSEAREWLRRQMGGSW